MDLIGQTIDRYEIREHLGQGGMAIVYRAYDTRLERDVAIKIIRRKALPEEQLERLLQRFEREAKAQAKFNHPNIVPIFDYGEYDGSPYLVMSLLTAGTLKEHTSGPMPVQEAARLLTPIASALAYAHARNVLHRDVKPSNILIDEHGTPFLADFGIAKLLETDQATLTGTGLGIGTPEYMAPEQWKGQSGPQTDIYALGVVLYELVTGRKPYTADTPAAVAIRQATEPLPPPRQFAAELPDAAERVILKAMAFKPEDRYATMAEFGSLLTALQMPQSLEDIDTTMPEMDSMEVAATEVDIQHAEVDRTRDGHLTPQPAVRSATPMPTEADDTPPPRPSTVSRADRSTGGKPGSAIPGWVWAAGGVTLVVLAALALRGGGLLPAPTERLGIGSSFVNPIDGARLLFIPAGEFIMGSEGGRINEKPAHTVTLDDYWMYEVEVANWQFALFVADTGHGNPGSSDQGELELHPVVYVTWDDAAAYCAWAGMRLPTEAEWEKAARGSDGREYPWGDAFDSSLTNSSDRSDGFEATAPVGSFPGGASPLGMLDMAGNVWEWTADLYGFDYYSSSPASNPPGPVEGADRVLRGGSWGGGPSNLRTAFRFFANPSDGYEFIGFRCANSHGP